VSRVARLLVAALLAATGAANAQTVRIDASGGPLTLEEDVVAAIDAWQGVAEPALGLAADDGGEVVIRYADAVRLGPDTLALTLQRQDVGAAPELEIVVNPVGYRRSPATIVHELGIVLGLGAGDDPTSVMRPAQGPDSPAAPSGDDAEALAAVRSAVPEDVDRNGSVDFYDLAALAADFGAQGINLPADIDGSGQVDEADLEALREAYRFTPPSRTPPGDPETDAEPIGLPELEPPAPGGDDGAAPSDPVDVEPDVGGEGDQGDPDSDGDSPDAENDEGAESGGGEDTDGEP
jgi:hypothetical protein